MLGKGIFMVMLSGIFLNVPFEQSVFAIETKTFMLKYGIFMLAGFLSALGTISIYNYKSVQNFVKHLITSMVVTLSIGIILYEYFSMSVELCFGVSLMVGLFLKYLIDNVIIVINKLPAYSDKVVDKYVDDDKDNKSDSSEA